MQSNLIGLLRNTAMRHPDKTAFADSGGKMTFGELYTAARNIGGYIASAGYADARSPFIIPVERSRENIAAMMGVLCSGNFYVPVDAAAPPARIAEIIAQLDPAGTILSGGSGAWRGNFSDGGAVIDYSEASAFETDPSQIEDIDNQITDMDPAYVLFTSGSTGKPKGIVVPHRAVIDLAYWLEDVFAFTSEDVLASQTPFYFDASIKDIYVSILTGATVAIMPKGIFSFPVKVVEFLNENKVTAALWATSASSMLSSSGVFEHTIPKYLSKVSFAGETLYAKHLNVWGKYLPGAMYVNLYGPTEATVDAAYYVVDRDFDDGEVVPIGKACRNMEVFLLDANDGQIPVERAGETGEICIRGAGVAHGYYGNPETTAQAFVQDPRNDRWREHIYKTGDLARYNDRGELVFISRADGQIKHMGARVELGDVEAAALSIPGVGSAVCIHDSANERIVVIYAGGDTESAVLRGLRQSLPPYMCPAVAVRLDSMPMTSNGKVDRVLLNENYKSGLYSKK